MKDKYISREKDALGGPRTIVRQISLEKIVDVNNFAELMGSIPCDIYAKSDNYVVNAKSLLGLCSLNLAQPIWIDIYGEVDDEFLSKVRVFIKDEEEK